MKYFVDEKSIVRQIWRKSDTVLLIFASTYEKSTARRAGSAMAFSFVLDDFTSSWIYELLFGLRPTVNGGNKSPG